MFYVAIYVLSRNKLFCCYFKMRQEVIYSTFLPRKVLALVPDELDCLYSFAGFGTLVKNWRSIVSKSLYFS